jgi:hypothetical protein
MLLFLHYVVVTDHGRLCYAGPQSADPVAAEEIFSLEAMAGVGADCWGLRLVGDLYFVDFVLEWNGMNRKCSDSRG